jgi:hypothetical protein
MIVEYFRRSIDTERAQAVEPGVSARRRGMERLRSSRPSMRASVLQQLRGDEPVLETDTRTSFGTGGHDE